MLTLFVQGRSNQQVAEALVIRLANVIAHISNVLSKLQVSSRDEAIAFAIKNKFASL